MKFWPEFWLPFACICLSQWGPNRAHNHWAPAALPPSRWWEWKAHHWPGREWQRQERQRRTRRSTFRWRRWETEKPQFRCCQLSRPATIKLVSWSAVRCRWVPCQQLVQLVPWWPTTTCLKMGQTDLKMYPLLLGVGNESEHLHTYFTYSACYHSILSFPLVKFQLTQYDIQISKQKSHKW